VSIIILRGCNVSEQASNSNKKIDIFWDIAIVILPVPVIYLIGLDPRDAWRPLGVLTPADTYFITTIAIYAFVLLFLFEILYVCYRYERTFFKNRLSEKKLMPLIHTLYKDEIVRQAIIKRTQENYILRIKHEKLAGLVPEFAEIVEIVGATEEKGQS
jgi:hypothetical protein